MRFDDLESWQHARQLNLAHASTAEIRSLSYVIEDNYPDLRNDAVVIREKASGTGQLVGGLIRSTESRAREDRQGSRD